MYKIYINERPLILCKTAKKSELIPAKGNVLVARYLGKVKFLINYIDLMEKTNRYDMVLLHTDDLENLWNDYQNLYKILEAAGGLVFNEANEILMIYRRGFWDLPKGKIEKGEKKELAALREVEEETGVHSLKAAKATIKKSLFHTSYHTYRTKKGKRILKPTYWFLMQAPKQDLIPQEEEDIEQAIWMNVNDIAKKATPIYRSIQDVLEKGISRPYKK